MVEFLKHTIRCSRNRRKASCKLSSFVFGLFDVVNVAGLVQSTTNFAFRFRFGFAVIGREARNDDERDETRYYLNV